MLLLKKLIFIKLVKF